MSDYEDIIETAKLILAPTREFQSTTFRDLAEAVLAMAEEIAELRVFLRAMLDTHCMHGPCMDHDCRSCEAAYDKAEAALTQPPTPGEEGE